MKSLKRVIKFILCNNLNNIDELIKRFEEDNLIKQEEEIELTKQEEEIELIKQMNKDFLSKIEYEKEKNPTSDGFILDENLKNNLTELNQIFTKHNIPNMKNEFYANREFKDDEINRYGHSTDKFYIKSECI